MTHLAAEHLSRDDADLAATAEDWIRLQEPAISDGAPLREQILPTMLTSTGVMTTSSAGWPRFTHRSLAEFLAAPTLAASLGPSLTGLDDASRFLHSDHADYERLVVTLASWAYAAGHKTELLWQRLGDDNAWQTLLAGRVAVETGTYVRGIASRLIGQLGLISMTDHEYGSDWEATPGVLGQHMHHPEVVREVRTLARAPILHPARRTAALALLARHCEDTAALDQIEGLGRRSSAFAALCAAEALIDAGAADRGLRLFTTVLRYADLPAGWIRQAGLRLIKAGYSQETVRLWKRWLSRRTPSDLDTQWLIADLGDNGEMPFARRVAQRLVRNPVARLDSRVFASVFLVQSDTSELPASDALADEGRSFLRHTIDDPNQETGHVVWIAEGMVRRGPDRDPAIHRLRLIRDAPENTADDRLRAARAVAACSASDHDAARAMVAMLPSHMDQTDGAWWQAALLADDLHLDAEATRFRKKAMRRTDDSSAIRTIIEQLGDSDPLTARAKILDIAARTSDDGVHYEIVRLLLYGGWIHEACDHVVRHATGPGIAPFWRNAIAGMTITAQHVDAALQLAAALSKVNDADDPLNVFWTHAWIELSEDLQPLENIMARAERWPPAKVSEQSRLNRSGIGPDSRVGL